MQSVNLTHLYQNMVTSQKKNVSKSGKSPKRGGDQRKKSTRLESKAFRLEMLNPTSLAEVSKSLNFWSKKISVKRL